jgi:NADH-quinone oxidoreductase B subunit
VAAEFGLACCAIEMIAASMARFDIARFGSEVFRPSPRQADLLIVSGTVTKKMAPQVVRLWNQMPEPKYCIAMGACAISGGPFKQGYNVLKGIDRFIPVDIYIPGCPPRPEALLHGLMQLQEKIRGEKLTGPDAPRHLRPTQPCELSRAGVRRPRPRAAQESRRLAAAGHRPKRGLTAPMETPNRSATACSPASPGRRSRGHESRPGRAALAPARRRLTRAPSPNFSATTRAALDHCSNVTGVDWPDRRKSSRRPRPRCPIRPAARPRSSSKRPSASSPGASRSSRRPARGLDGAAASVDARRVPHGRVLDGERS